MSALDKVMQALDEYVQERIYQSQNPPRLFSGGSYEHQRRSHAQSLRKASEKLCLALDCWKRAT